MKLDDVLRVAHRLAALEMGLQITGDSDASLAIMIDRDDYERVANEMMQLGWSEHPEAIKPTQLYVLGFLVLPRP